jgi:phage shock protein A
MGTTEPILAEHEALASALRVANAEAEQLAYDEQIHLERIAHLESLIVAYQALAREGIQTAARLTRECDGLRRQLAAMREESRRLRAEVMRTHNVEMPDRVTGKDGKSHQATTRHVEVLVANQLRRAEGATCH